MSNSTNSNCDPQQVPNNLQEQDPTICVICHGEPPTNAVRLGCGHIFCYLCAKSEAQIRGICPLCRTEISIGFDTQEHSIIGVARLPTSSDGYYWFYEGARGWWLFDADTNSDIEDAFVNDRKYVEKFIAGSIYSIDLDKMEQRRKDGSGRARKLIRSTLKLENIVGMAGIRGEDFEDLLDLMRSASDLPILG